MPSKIKNSETVTARIGGDFDNELTEIKKERVNRKIDKKKKSTRRLTNLIVKHDDWPKMKEDLINKNLEEKNDE